MFALNKIRGHIKMQELRQLKLTRFLEEENSLPVPNAQRVKDIQRALHRVNENIKLWSEKLDAIENAPARQLPRPAINDGPDQPLIG